MQPVICRTLKREYRFHADPETADRIRFIEAAPQMAGVDLTPVDIAIDRRDGFLVATMPSGEIVEGTAYHLLGAMHRLLLADLVDGDPGAPLLHGATVLIEGQRLLIVGHKGAGKSTLALHLAVAGHGVEGDEHMLIRSGSVVARPRTLRVKDGTLAMVKPLPDQVWQAPRVPGWDGTSSIRALSPALAGREWIIRAGQLSGIVILVANHGGRSRARGIAREKAFAHLMAEAGMPATGVAAAAARIRALAMSVPSFELRLGDLATAEWHLIHVARLLT